MISLNNFVINSTRINTNSIRDKKLKLTEIMNPTDSGPKRIAVYQTDHEFLPTHRKFVAEGSIVVDLDEKRTPSLFSDPAYFLNGVQGWEGTAYFTNLYGEYIKGKRDHWGKVIQPDQIKNLKYDLFVHLTYGEKQGALFSEVDSTHKEEIERVAYPKLLEAIKEL